MKKTIDQCMGREGDIKLARLASSELLQTEKVPEFTQPNANKSVNGKRLHSPPPDNTGMYADMVEESVKENPPDEDNMQCSDKMEMHTESQKVESSEAQLSKGQLVILN